MVDHTPRTATLKTEEPTLMLFIDPDLFERILKVPITSIICETTVRIRVFAFDSLIDCACFVLGV
jgi:hypothetical protein